MRRALLLRVSIVAVAAAAATTAWAMHGDREFSPPEPFVLESRPLGGARAAPAAPAYLTSARIASVGDGALALDADSGALILADRDGASVAQLPIGHDAGLLAYDPVARTAYVADRRGDRIVVATVGDKLAAARRWATPAEPYGVALTPDRATVLVTAIADRALVAYDAATGRERWRAALGAEPRGVAISPDGTRALVAGLATGAVDEIALAAPHAVTQVALAAPAPGSLARGAFTATFLGDELAVVPFQRDVPVAGSIDEEDGGGDDSRYGGSFLPPVSYHVAFLGRAGGAARQVVAQTSAHQPRALAWDGAHDALYLAGLGNDEIVQITHASQIDAAAGAHVSLGGKGPFPGADRCGPDGLAVTVDGDLLVWCSFTRSIARLSPIGEGDRLAVHPAVTRGPSLVPSLYDDDQHTGFVVFHTADANVSAFGALACASCHLDGRTDGLSWTIHGRTLQTPLLSGRLVGTAPFKWDGTAADLRTSLGQTIGRLGGSGLSKKHTAALVAYLESLAPVRTPTADAAAVARGRTLFESSELGCSGCHEGAVYTDGDRHEFAGSLAHSDTPSLIGLAASAPYFHDGSAATLEVVLRDRGAVHGMAEPATHLTDPQIADLRAFLESL